MINPPPLSSRRELLKWTIELLKEFSIRPRKKLSQNFVVEPRVVRDILSRTPDNTRAIEIGTGLGVISYFLSRRRAYTIHYEVDERLGLAAELFLGKLGTLVVSDALLHEWNMETIVSNAPYHITSDIIIKTCRSNSVERAVFVFQKDVVDRLLAKPGTREYGRITVLTNLLFDIEPGPVYPRSYFYPEPEVNSRLVVFMRKRPYDELFSVLEDVTRRLFHKRRKKAIKVIRDELGLHELKMLKELGIDELTRVYELSPSVILRLAEIVREQYGLTGEES